MKKRLMSLVLSLCMSIMLIPSTVFAEQTDWKELYFNFIKSIYSNNSNDLGTLYDMALADINLDGTPELMIYDLFRVPSYCQIIDNEIQLRFKSGLAYDIWFTNAKKDYITEMSPFGCNGSAPSYAYYNEYDEYDEYYEWDYHDQNQVHTFALRKNKNTGELMYTNLGVFGQGDMFLDFNYFSKDKLFTQTKKFHITYDVNSFGDPDATPDNKYYIDGEYGEYIDGNSVSEAEFDNSFKAFVDEWQDTGYRVSCLGYDYYNSWEKTLTDQQIRDFLNYYIPEKQFLGIADEDTSNKYGYVDVQPISRQEFDDCYDIKVKYTNQSGETITNKRIVLGCTTLTNSKTKRQSEVVVSYKDNEEVFNPYEEKSVITRIHCKKTSEGIPYTMGDKPFSANYQADHSFLDNMTLLTIQFANDKEYNEFMADIEANNLLDLSTDENIENNTKWLKALKGDK